MKTSYSILLLALTLAGSGCQEIDPPTKHADDEVVESYYKPLPGRQVARVVYKSDFARTFEFTYDALGRIQKTVCTTVNSDGKTITEEHEYRYGKDYVAIDGTRCPLNSDGCITEIQQGIAVMKFAYDGYLFKLTYESPKMEPKLFSIERDYNFNYSITAVKQDGLSNCVLEYEPKYTNNTNLDITALITNAHYVFEMWVAKMLPAIGTFGFYEERNHKRFLLPTAETYLNGVRTTFEYEFVDKEIGCPQTIYCTDSNGKEATYSFEYVE